MSPPSPMYPMIQSSKTTIQQNNDSSACVFMLCLFDTNLATIWDEWILTTVNLDGCFVRSFVVFMIPRFQIHWGARAFHFGAIGGHQG